MDTNHASIIRTLKRCGCRVLSLHQLGGGVPDLLIHFNNGNYLLEVKDTHGQLRDSQREFMRRWPNVYVVRTTNDVVSLLNKLRRE